MSEKKPDSFPKDLNNRVKTPTIYQMEATECGAASLAMVLAHFGVHIPLEKLRIETGVSRDGCNALNIIRAAKKYGFVCDGYTKDVEGLYNMKMPCIIHWNFNHFVVLEGFRNGYVYLNDPAVGRRRLEFEDFDDAFTGVTLEFTPTENVQKTKRSITLPGFLYSRLRGQEKGVLALLGTGLVLVAPGLILPILSQVFVDNVLVGGNTGWLGPLLLAMVGTALFQLFYGWYQSKLQEKLLNKMTLLSMNRFLTHLFQLPVEFFEQRMSGDLVSRVQSNSDVDRFMGGQFASTLLSVFMAVFYFFLMIVYSVPLTIIGVIGIAISLTLSQLANKRLSDIAMKQQQDNSKMVGSLYSGLAITSTLKASGVESDYVARVLGYCSRAHKTEQRLGRMQEVLSAVPSAAGQVTNIIVLMAGGVLVVRGSLTAGMLMAFNQFLSSFSSPVNTMIGFFQSLQTMKADIKRVQDIEKYPVAPQFEDRPHAYMEDKLEGSLELRNISFGYSRLKPPMVNGISFTLRPGSSVALVGPSGCGKSTISKIVSGLYDPWEGEVLIDGVPLREIPPAIFCDGVATVSQSITLFSGSIRDNLTFWNKKVMEKDIIQAARDACIHDTITALPGAYDYYLSEGGSNLSGGQRQRLEIARALINNPSILVLDEATSALDPLVEKQVINNIRRRGCTCVIVAHRLSTIRDCDEILVMEQGVVVERGSHEQLRSAGGRYAALLRNI